MPKPERIICGGRQAWAVHMTGTGWVCTCCRRPVPLRLVQTPLELARGGEPFVPYTVTVTEGAHYH